MCKSSLERNEANQRVLLVKLTVKISFTIEIQSLGLGLLILLLKSVKTC